MNKCNNRINANTCLKLGDTFHSCNGNFTLIFQECDGNLAIYRNKKYNPRNCIFASGTANQGADKACISLDGNFVIYSKKWTLWETYTHFDADELYAMIEDSGSLGIFQRSQRLWSSGAWLNDKFFLIKFIFRSVSSYYKNLPP